MSSSTNRARVALVPVENYDPHGLEAAMGRAVQLLDISADDFADQRLLLKPNLLVASEPEAAICTHPQVVGAVIRTLGVKARQVWVGDSPAIGSNSRAAARLGLDGICSEHGAQLVEFDQYEEVACPDGEVVKRLPLADVAVQADAVISCAKLKTHGLTAYTGAVKNLYGCVPGTHKAELHLRLQNIEDFCGMLVDLYQRVAPKLAVIDGIVAMEGAGPRNGQPKKLGALIVSKDAVAADAVASQLIGLSPLKIVPLRIAHERALGQADPAKIEVVGSDIAQMRDPSFKTNAGTHSALGGIPPFLHRLLQSHVTARPVITPELCRSCRICEQHCPPRAITMEGTAKIDYANCIRCYCCQELCPHNAIDLRRGALSRLVQHLHR